MITRDRTVVIEPNPLHLLVKPVPDWDVEIGDLAIVKGVASGGIVEGVLVV
jgi:hypothetical protein